MPLTFSETNVNVLFPEVWSALHDEGIVEHSRNGPVLSFPYPTILESVNPQEKVFFCPTRRINPFFALAECIWMLAGLDEVEYLARYNPRMREYSDDGRVLTGSAYGYRWRNHFGRDQLLFAIEELKRNPESRRIVLSHWDPREDLFNTSSKDLPCNLQIILRASEGRLNMTVTNRSNDLIYGSLGANSCHFGFLLEFLCAVTGLSVGSLYQIPNNLHVYTETEIYKRILQKKGPVYDGSDPYWKEKVLVHPLLGNGEQMEDFLHDCDVFFRDPVTDFRCEFFRNIVWPMEKAFIKWKSGNPSCLKELPAFSSYDWIIASRKFLGTTKLLGGA